MSCRKCVIKLFVCICMNIHSLIGLITPGSEWVSQHALSINNKRKDITKEDLLAIGESIKCKKTLSIIHEINSTVKQWEKFAHEVKVSTELRKNITKTLLDMS